MPLKNNPLTPFIKGDFLNSPLKKGDSGGCLVCYDTKIEIPEHCVTSFQSYCFYVLAKIMPSRLIKKMIS